MHPEFPKISIITICYNAAETIEKTIKSVVAQDYPNIEYIIIDGKSKDDTLTIVEQYRAHIALVISEPDQGIYDAMNKGIDHASGDYIWYMHADDQIYAPNTLSLIMANHQYEDFIYGKALLIDEAGNERSLETRKPHPNDRELSWKTMKQGMAISHQAMLIKRTIAPKYDLAYRYVADFDWLIRVLKKSTTVRDTGVYWCRFAEGGISTQHRVDSLKERFAILQKHFGLIPTIWQHFLISLKALKRGSIR
ncbi:glycosyltransferase family 2 protein [Aureispira anguillae]|uniref:Glycosyltransferase n=1 Tax=Aureispira anguillae TaxID=2864201 RepID=A0A915YAW6_9BACT|nr:glycosyltransferase family 2 protein [Aureispira anguillae]BDS09345.1 glycosyltransferase [Aureispira anguillae]